MKKIPEEPARLALLSPKTNFSVRFSIGDPPANSAPPQKKVPLEKSLRFQTRGGPAPAAEAG